MLVVLRKNLIQSTKSGPVSELQYEDVYSRISVLLQPESLGPGLRVQAIKYSPLTCISGLS